MDGFFYKYKKIRFVGRCEDETLGRSTAFLARSCRMEIMRSKKVICKSPISKVNLIEG